MTTGTGMGARPQLGGEPFSQPTEKEGPFGRSLPFSLKNVSSSNFLLELEVRLVLGAVDQFHDQLPAGSGPVLVGLPDVDVLVCG
jgi:hypothetical protein